MRSCSGIKVDYGGIRETVVEHKRYFRDRIEQRRIAQGEWQGQRG